MKLLHYFFNIIWPERGKNWLSIRFARWFFNNLRKQEKLWEEANTGIKSRNPHQFFGYTDKHRGVAVSESINWSSGDRIGLSFAQPYGCFGYVHTTIGRREAKRMAEFILERIATETESEEDQLIRQEKEYEALKEKVRLQQLEKQ